MMTKIFAVLRFDEFQKNIQTVGARLLDRG